MEVSEIKRVFKYKNQILEDIPGLPETEVIKVYSGRFPELVNATVQYKGMSKDYEQEYEFVTTTGVKG